MMDSHKVAIIDDFLVIVGGYSVSKGYLNDVTILKICKKSEEKNEILRFEKLETTYINN